MALNPDLGLQQFRQQFGEESSFSYLVFDRSGQEALLIDPDVTKFEEYLEFLKQNGLDLKFVIDTHSHADHFSASHLFRPAPIGMSERTASQRPTHRLKDGEVFRIGKLSFTVADTPGHTQDSICLLGEGVLFSGDTLLIGTTGRADFEGGSADALWASLQKLKALPGETLIYPAHDLHGRLFSRIDVERRKNPDLRDSSEAAREAFLERKKSEAMAALPQEVLQRLEFNHAKNPQVDLVREALKSEFQCASSSADDTTYGTLSVEKYRQKLQRPAKDNLFLDVREPEEYRAEHMAGVRNLPLSEIGLRLEELSGPTRIYVSCQSGRRSSFAAKTLNYIGLSDVVNVEGGIRAWKNAGFPVVEDAEE